MTRTYAHAIRIRTSARTPYKVKTVRIADPHARARYPHDQDPQKNHPLRSAPAPWSRRLRVVGLWARAVQMCIRGPIRHIATVLSELEALVLLGRLSGVVSN